MAVSIRHVLEQGPVLRALGRTAFSAMVGRGKAPTGAPVQAPGPWVEEILPPRSEKLINDYVRHVGGDPSWYRGRVPASLFPQWGFPLQAQTLLGVPYPLERVMNAGCRIEQKAPLPSGQPLHVRARLESVDDDGRRAILTQTIVTGTKEVPEAIVATLRAYVPLGSKDKTNGKGSDKPKEKSAPKDRPTVPLDAHEIAFFKVAADAGLDFAKLTGDFNPIHWIAPYARAAGFGTCILHGFSTLARAIEAIDRRVLAGDPSRLQWVDARFTRPLRLPARVGVYVSSDGGLWVGDSPGGGAYLEGRFALTKEESSTHA